MREDHHEKPHAPDHPMTEFEWRVDAVQALLIEKGILTSDEIRRAVEEMDARMPAQGARVVARAWVDPAFKARLLADAKATISELGITVGFDATIVAVENTEKVHHAVVCTLCSCYPRGLLGYPPDWYKSLNYRSRVVVEPRSVLREFGLELPPDVEVRVRENCARCARGCRLQRICRGALARHDGRDDEDHGSDRSHAGAGARRRRGPGKGEGRESRPRERREGPAGIHAKGRWRQGAGLQQGAAASHLHPGAKADHTRPGAGPERDARGGREDGDR